MWLLIHLRAAKNSHRPGLCARTALETTLSGLVLENAYDPKRISEDQVVSVLRRVFDMLVQSE
jgi:hypothetical protein